MAGKPSGAVQALTKDVAELKAVIGDQITTINDMVAAVNKIAESVSTMAKNYVAVPNKHFEADEQFLGAEGNAVMSEDAAGNQILTVPDGTHVDDPLFSEKMKMLQFNEGLIDVHIHDNADEQMPKTFEVFCNGIPQFLTHGKVCRMKRKFVEILMRAKPAKFGNVERNDPATGEKEYVYPVSKGLKFGFSLVNPTPIEQQWIAAVAAQP